MRVIVWLSVWVQVYACMAVCVCAHVAVGDAEKRQGPCIRILPFPEMSWEILESAVQLSASLLSLIGEYELSGARTNEREILSCVDLARPPHTLAYFCETLMANVWRWGYKHPKGNWVPGSLPEWQSQGLQTGEKWVYLRMPLAEQRSPNTGNESLPMYLLYLVSAIYYF